MIEDDFVKIRQIIYDIFRDLPENDKQEVVREVGNYIENRKSQVSSDKISE